MPLKNKDLLPYFWIRPGYHWRLGMSITRSLSIIIYIPLVPWFYWIFSSYMYGRIKQENHKSPLFVLYHTLGQKPTNGSQRFFEVHCKMKSDT